MTTQVGGDHYASGEYQHWDWASDAGLDYFGSAATKYVLRHRRKNGLEDLLKAETYIQKKQQIIEQGPIWRRLAHHLRFLLQNKRRQSSLLDRLAKGSGLLQLERQFLYHCAVGRYDDALWYLGYIIRDLHRNTESEAMSAYIRGGVDHPAPFGYDGNG